VKLKGKTGLVTGAGRGIGRAIALALARAGAEVAVLDIVRESAEAVRREVEALGVKGLALAVDLGALREVDGEGEPVTVLAHGLTNNCNELAALTPRPAITRLICHGVLGPHARGRRQVVGSGRAVASDPDADAADTAVNTHRAPGPGPP